MLTYDIVPNDSLNKNPSSFKRKEKSLNKNPSNSRRPIGLHPKEIFNCTSTIMLNNCGLFGVTSMRTDAAITISGMYFSILWMEAAFFVDSDGRLLVSTFYRNVTTTTLCNQCGFV